MRKFILSVFCCSFIFSLYMWTWISWHTWTSAPKAKETERIATCCDCTAKEKDKHADIGYPETLLGKSCLKTSKIYGVPSHRSKFLAIGIPTVKRKKANYLHKTLKSLVKNLDQDEKSIVTVVVLIADSDEQLRRSRADELWSEFLPEIQSGFIVIIQAVMKYYPNMDITRRTFNDSLERIQWRSKQVTDFAFLFNCAQDVGDYFLILEDDVEASSHYVSAIRHFILAKEGQDWVSLTFSGFFIIGRLLKNEVLKKLSDFLLMFYKEKPVDLLIVQFLDLMVQNKYVVTRRIPGLFQHNGLYSSLEGKVQKARDRSFASGEDLANPPADVVTTLGVYKKHFPELCYSSSKKFFWGSAPKVNDTFDIILHRPIKLRKLSITSGHSLHKNDIISFADLKVSPSFQKMVTNNKADCLNFHPLAFFKGGIVDLEFKNTTAQGLTVQCIRIEFIKKQSNWILIQKIVVRGEDV